MARTETLELAGNSEANNDNDDDLSYTQHENDDDGISVSSSNNSISSQQSYIDPSENDLGILSGAALLTADCMGTGILALPHDMKVLGVAFGLGFLVLNLPINYYAGLILGRAASFVEKRLGHSADHHEHDDTDAGNHAAGTNMLVVTEETAVNSAANTNNNSTMNGPNVSHQQQHPHLENANTCDFIGMTMALYDLNCAGSSPSALPIIPPSSSSAVATNGETTMDFNYNTTTAAATSDNDNEEQKSFQNNMYSRTTTGTHHNKHPNTPKTTRATIAVTAVYYTNIFLVLGNYILVMSHAVAAMVGEDQICLPTAGLLASTLMFGMSQLRTMAKLGRSASAISLGALAIVVMQCLVAIHNGDDRYERYMEQEQENNDDEGNEVAMMSMWQSVMGQLAALASIGFAVGSQKLFLNIRHEFKRREEAPKSLAIALTTFGGVYVLVCILAGPDPPSLLFDAISPGIKRRIAGLLLWVHVAVSFAINSQALCSSIDRLKFHRVTICNLRNHHKTRWAALTFLVALSSYFIANAVPFFKDLVALIGALTSVPLTLLLPAIYHRRIIHAPLWTVESKYDVLSYLLMVFALVFLICGVIGSLSSIEIDWAHHGPPFACR